MFFPPFPLPLVIGGRPAQGRAWRGVEVRGLGEGNRDGRVGVHGSLGSAGESAGQKGYGQLGQATKGHLRPSGVEAAEPGRDRRWASCWCLPFSFPLSVLGELSSFSFSYMVFLFFFFFWRNKRGFSCFILFSVPSPMQSHSGCLRHHVTASRNVTVHRFAHMQVGLRSRPWGHRLGQRVTRLWP